MIALKNILVATDFSEPADAALRYGKELARRFDASLHVLHVVDDLTAYPSAVPGMPTLPGSLQQEIQEDAHANLASLVSPPDRAALHAHLEVVVSAWPGRAILDYANGHEIDLIIVGTHGRSGLSHLFMGSVAEHVSRRASCPVMTVRSDERDFIHVDALQKTQQVSS